MKTHTPTAPAPLDAMAILARARVRLWHLQGAAATNARIDPKAAAAVTHDRHGAKGLALAKRILDTLQADASDAAITAAIDAALVKGEEAR